MSDELPGVEPHGSLTEFLPNVFTVQGSVVMMPLVRIPRQMAVVKSGDELTLINAVRLNDEGTAALDALGAVKNVVRIGMHGMDDAHYVAKYGAKLWALPGVEHANGQKTTHELSDTALPFDGARLFRFELTQLPEAALVHEPSGTLITCDSVQNWESTDGCSMMGGVVTKLFGFIKPAQIGPPWRKRMTPKDGTLKPDFDRLAALPFKHLIGGHGVPLRDQANERFRETLTGVYG